MSFTRDVEACLICSWETSTAGAALGLDSAEHHTPSRNRDMMQRPLLAVAAVVLAACSPAPDATVAVGTIDQARVEVARSQERQYQNAVASGSATDRCDQARAAAETWLSARNQSEHARWQEIAARDCATAAAAP